MREPSEGADPRVSYLGHRSPVPIIGEDVIFILHAGMAREPALGVVALGRLVG
jgi:hypothetical protein